MSEPIVSRIQSIQDRIKEIENFGKPQKGSEKPATVSSNKETFSQMMQEVSMMKGAGDAADNAEYLPQDLLQNRTDTLSNLVEKTIREAASAAGVTAGKSQDIRDIVSRAAREHGVDPNLVHAIIRSESNYNPKAVSYRGAQGLMQLMPATAQELGVSDSFDPEQNIFGGTRYIKEMLERYQGDLVRALAAYNAGPSAVDKAKGIPNYAETQIYVPRVLKTYYKLNRED